MNNSQSRPLSDKQMVALQYFLLKNIPGGVERKLRQMIILLLSKSENLTQEVVISLIEQESIPAQFIKKIKDQFDTLVSRGSIELDLIFTTIGTDFRFHMRSQESHGKATLVMSCAPKPTSTAPVIITSLQDITDVNIEQVAADYEKARMN